jgi:hypothetical protein
VNSLHIGDITTPNSHSQWWPGLLCASSSVDHCNRVCTQPRTPDSVKDKVLRTHCDTLSSRCLIPCSGRTVNWSSFQTVTFERKQPGTSNKLPRDTQSVSSQLWHVIDLSWLVPGSVSRTNLFATFVRVLTCSNYTIVSSTFGVSGLTVAVEVTSTTKPWRSCSRFDRSCKQASSVVSSRESWITCSCPCSQLSL